ncbi:MAG: hypothetical protein GQ477_03225 [Nanohaloarchaea archaeon]|nr:hypothetical protein [Candidatus Nanohaloarchaea archaeon]
MAVSDILKNAYNLVKNNFRESLLIGLIFWSAVLIIEGFFIVTGLVTLEQLSIGTSPMISVMSIFLSFVLAMLSGGVYYSINLMRDKKIKLSNIRKGIDTRWADIFKAFIVIQFIAAIVGSMINILMDNYMLTSTSVSVFVYSLFFVIALSVQLSLIFSIPIVAATKVDGFSAVKKSVKFFTGNVSLVAGAILSVFVIFFSVMLVILGITGIAGYLAEISIYLSIPFLLAIAVLMFFVLFLAFPFMSFVIVGVYKEGTKK